MAEGSERRTVALKLWTVLSRAQRAVEKHSLSDIRRHDLTPGEFGALEALYHRGPLLLGELQEKILVSSGGITYIVDRLTDRGLVTRRPCPDDRRARFAELTPEGEELIERIFPEHARCIEHAVSGLEPDEQRQAIDLLRRLGRRAAELEPGPAE